MEYEESIFSQHLYDNRYPIVLHSRNDNNVRNQGLPSDTVNEFGLNKGLENFTSSPWKKNSTQKEGKCHTVTERTGEENADTFLITNDVESIKVDDEAEKNEANSKFNSIKMEIVSDEEIEIEESVQDSLALADVDICHVCDMKFENRLMVAKHLLSSYHKSRSLAYPQAHLEMMEKYDEFVVKFCPFHCAICIYYFNSYEDFQEHCQTADHKSHCRALSGEIVCTLCDFKTGSCTDIEEHLLSIDHLEALRKSKKIFILKEQPEVPRCKHCGLEFRSHASVLQHMQQEHAVKKQTSRNVRNGVCCPHCEKKLPSKAALNRHLLFSHENSLKTKNTEQKEALTLKTKIKRTEVIHDNHDADTDKMKEVSASAGDEQTSHIVKQGKISGEKAQIDKNQLNKIKIPTDDNSDGDTDIVLDKKTEKKRKPKQQKSDKPKKTFKCDHCDLTVSGYKELGEHYKDEHANETRRCEPCNKVFYSEKAYNAHCISKSHKVQSTSNISGVGSNVFECEICHEGFPDKNYRDYHTTYIHFHPSEASLKKERETNSITYEKHKDFIDHMDANCTKSERLLCPICGASLQKATMMAHLRTHTGEAPFVCKLCTGIAFYSRNGLRKHLFQHYIKSNHCNICSKDFKSLSAFRKHTTVHMAVKRGEKHVCDVCGVTFPLLTRLMTHKLRHSEKSFPCDFPGCHMTFYFNGERTRHKKEVHEKEKTFLCDYVHTVQQQGIS
ncbi:ZN407-like protein [Mya arenaria]|uniref:ZN407-like protein n=1 Tax=Mya arenaria TaxID=6604 RepID=A0ABY7EQG1_MYAAR|nr:ZN407-like protein [Mya arenaria]